ncbi:hypothetical protein M405DRAFT_928936 [Rhizopogon salebrosus TDB-379]|nr:hypothetical protein M405DRAFT_928936 [Rhizopogon salebrosus TDB-379]
MATTVADAFALQVVKSVKVAAAGLLVFDYCITFGDEARSRPRNGSPGQTTSCLLYLRQVRWTLKKDWRIPRVAFVLSRYMPFIGAIMTAYSGVKYRQGGNCTVFNDISNAAHFMGIIGSEALLLLRTYVFWRCTGGKKFLIVMVPFSLAAIIVAVVLDTAPISFGIPESSPPCVLEGPRSSTLPYSVLMLYELVLMTLTIFKRYRNFENLGSSIIKSLYRDGVLYMLCITLISTANVVIVGALPIAYSELLNTPQIVIHSVLASRILFNLQETSDINLVQETITDFQVRVPPGFESVEV